MYEKLKEIRYYGLGDEGEELFAATCHLCYKMNGLGDNLKAETLFAWAKDMADESKRWCEQEGIPLDENDSITGQEATKR